MLFSGSLSVLLAIASSASAFPALWSKDVDFSSSSIIEKLNGPPAGWTQDDSITFDKNAATVQLRIHLIRQGVEKFSDLAMNIATPGHELYGKHLSQDVIRSMIAPKDESKNLVLEWLASEDLIDYASLSAHSDAVIVDASLAQIEKLLKTEYSAFVREETGDAVIRTLEYSLPNALAGHVKMVQPTTFFGLRALRSDISSVHPTNHTESINEIEAVTGCSGSTITPTCLANLYNFASSTGTQTAGLMGIAGFIEQHPSQSDLKTFMSALHVFSNTDETYTCTLINDGTCPTTSEPGVEANLDVQYARAITKEIPNVFYSTGGSPPIVSGSESPNTNEPYLQFLDFLLDLSDDDLPNTISISYGDDEDTVPLDYADEVCTLFSTLGARGVSILVASGDSGVGTDCDSGADGSRGFDTSFPASCPWVTVVGGTTGNSPERAWTDGGGGFSNVFGQPSYQKTVVDSWVSKTGDSSGFSSFFNTSGRAYPDVAAQATNFVIVVDGEEEGVDGTSCATPTFASVIQLVNSELVASGSSPLGFLNPWLYSTVSGTSGLTDITSGSNSGCSGVISGAGFDAVTGWDPATGLGTPNYEELLSLATG